MSISVLTLLCVYVRYNGLYIKLKLLGLYNNIFFIKVSKTENRFKTSFQQPKTGFTKNPVFTSLVSITEKKLLFDLGRLKICSFVMFLFLLQ